MAASKEKESVRFKCEAQDAQSDAGQLSVWSVERTQQAKSGSQAKRLDRDKLFGAANTSAKKETAS